MKSPNKRLARVNGNLKAIVTSEEFQANGITIDGVKKYPVTFMGDPEMVPAIIHNADYFEMRTGEKYNDLKHWSI